MYIINAFRKFLVSIVIFELHPDTPVKITLPETSVMEISAYPSKLPTETIASSEAGLGDRAAFNQAMTGLINKRNSFTGAKVQEIQKLSAAKLEFLKLPHLPPFRINQTHCSGKFFQK